MEKKECQTAKICFNKAQYAADRISSIKGFKLFFKRNFIKEFTVETKFDAKLCEDAENGYLFDLIDTNLVKFAFTEKGQKSN